MSQRSPDRNGSARYVLRTLAVKVFVPRATRPSLLGRDPLERLLGRAPHQLARVLQGRLDGDKLLRGHRSIPPEPLHGCPPDLGIGIAGQGFTSGVSVTPTLPCATRPIASR